MEVKPDPKAVIASYDNTWLTPCAHAATRACLECRHNNTEEWADKAFDALMALQAENEMFRKGMAAGEAACVEHRAGNERLKAENAAYRGAVNRLPCIACFNMVKEALAALPNEATE